MQTKMKLLAVALTVAFSGAAQAQYSGFKVFGDSLSDAGTFGASFTTNPGPVWSKTVATALGQTGTPAQVLGASGFTATGGNIWAQGGATVASTGYGMVMAQPLRTQMSTYLASVGGKVDGNGLYALWGGANDVFTQISAYGAGTISSASLQANVTAAAQTMGGIAQQLQQAGARNIVVINLPDMGKTPGGLAMGATTAAALTNLAALYNASLQSTLGALGVHAVMLDANGLFNEIIANPNGYGFKVLNTGVACTTQSSLTCSTSTLVSSDAARTYLFADGVHPTTAGHQIIADYVLSTLQAPALAARAADHLALASENYWAGSDSRQLRFLNGDLPAGNGDFYVQGQYGSVHGDAWNGQSGFNGHPGSLAIGFDRSVREGSFIGAALNFQQDRFDLNTAQTGGHADARGFGINFYGGWRADRFYVSGATMLGSSRYELRRSFALGATTRSESGDASGSVKGMRLELGYDLARGELRHGPFANLTYRKVTLAGYEESSASATALRYGEQRFDQLRAGLGYQLAWQINPALRLSGRASVEQELKDSQRELALGVVNTQGELLTSAGRSAKQTYQRLAVQADWRLTPTSALTTVIGGSSGNNANQAALSVNYSLRF